MDVKEIKVPFRRYTKELLSSDVTKRTIALLASQFSLVFLSFITAPINARVLKESGYGILALWGTITGFTLLFFRFGFFSSCRLLLAQNTDPEREKELLAASLVVGVGVGLLYAILMLGVSWSVDAFFKVQIGYLIRKFLPFLVFSPFSMFLPAIAEGTGKTNVIAWSSVLNRVLMFCAIVGLFAIKKLNVETAIGSGVIVRAIVFSTAFFVVFKIKWRNLKTHVKEIWKIEKRYGVHVYTAQIIDQPALSLTNILLGKFAGHIELGFYSIAQTICQPISALPKALGIVVHKQLAHRVSIPKKYSYAVIIWMALGALAVITVGPILIIVLFGERFKGVIPILLPVVLVYISNGSHQLLNSFISVKGKGTWMRNTSLCTGIASVVTALILVPSLKVYGAAFSLTIANIVFLGCCIYYYRKFRFEVKTDDRPYAP